ncbi:hypothetical protein PHJA_000173100 [Phtheirospermum japonicum]|uniref:Uncharacterized protein n=1 Tax=Phtheirospermum japonicum TaxID=374723 RepID=A0A830B005_9LAMI|nr:hypothetical protein PHJA_000173100 [Phtheirospermum japonicum]
MAQGLFPAHASPDKGSSPLSSPSLNQCRHIPTLARVLPNHSSKCRKPSALLAHNRTGFRNPSMRRARSSHHPARRVSSHTGTRFSHTCRTRSASSYATCACAEPTRHIKPTVEHRCTSAPFSHVCAELAQHIKATIKHRLIPAPNASSHPDTLVSVVGAPRARQPVARLGQQVTPVPQREMISRAKESTPPLEYDPINCICVKTLAKFDCEKNFEVPTALHCFTDASRSYIGASSDH